MQNKATTKIAATLKRFTALVLMVLLSLSQKVEAQTLKVLPLRFQNRRGGILIAAVIGLGVLTIVLPLVYLISASVANAYPTGSLSTAQQSTLTSLVAAGGAALQLTSVAETVVGAGIIILGIALYFRLRG